MSGRKNLRIDEDLTDWFEETYPRTSLSGLLSDLLREYKELHKEFTPKLYEEMAAREYIKNNTNDRQ